MEMVEDRLSTVFAALADPTRRAILAQLKDGAASVTALGRPFAMSQPAISRHLKVLERAGLISRARHATVRLSRIEGEALGEVRSWLEGYRQWWDDSFEQLDELLSDLQQDQREAAT
jgi:DNA-binding transcriptional ArsR family regulator